MTKTNFARLSFRSDLNDLGDGKELCYGLSSVVQIGNSLWVTNDETVSLERFNLVTQDVLGNYQYGDHRQFHLSDYFDLPVSPQVGKDIDEADVEGLAYENGYLWLVGSHSLKRSKPKFSKSLEDDLERLATIRPEGNRYLIGRIPVVSEDGTYTLKKKVDQDSGRNAARLHGNKESDDLTRELMQDRHLGPFLMIPSKDNGFDIEGLTAANNRLFIGLRGPVLRGWAIILEVEMKEDDSSHTTLRLKRIGPHDQCYRKHFVQLGGLGIRDLCTQGPDLLILAGPTMELDGPVAIFRWRCGAEQKGESIIPSSGLEHVMPIPYGEGEDHAEGMTLFTPDGGVPRSVFVVYDSCSKERRTEADATQADIFALPD